MALGLISLEEHEDGDMECLVCYQTFATYDELNAHMKMHPDEAQLDALKDKQTEINDDSNNINDINNINNSNSHDGIQTPSGPDSNNNNINRFKQAYSYPYPNNINNNGSNDMKVNGGEIQYHGKGKKKKKKKDKKVCMLLCVFIVYDNECGFAVFYCVSLITEY